MEIAPLAGTLHEWSRHTVDLVTTGVGMVASAARCSRALACTPYDLALNFGVCGSFDLMLTPGTVVHVVSDRLVELGAEDGEKFLTLKDLKLDGADEFVNVNPPVNATTAARRVWARAILTAFSIASAPVVKRIAFRGPSPVSAQSRAASSTYGSYIAT